MSISAGTPRRVPLIILALSLVTAGYAAAGDTTLPAAAPQAADGQRTGLSSAPRCTTKVGYVDMTRIAEDSRRGKALQERLKEKRDTLQTRIDGRRKQLDKQRSALEARLATLSPSQREARYREFQKKVEEFQKLGQDSERELLTIQDDEAKKLYAEIERAADAYGRANGLALVIPRKELLYISRDVDAEDITDKLLTSIDADGKK
jgi:outer membrane protein